MKKPPYKPIHKLFNRLYAGAGLNLLHIKNTSLSANTNIARKLSAVLFFIFSLFGTTVFAQTLYSCDFDTNLGNFNGGGNNNSSNYSVAATPALNSVQGTFAILTNPYPMNENFYITSGDHTTGSGKMMVIDGGNSSSSKVFAANNGNSITGLNIGSQYVFSYWILNVNNAAATNNLATIEIYRNDGTGAVQTNVCPANNSWSKVSYTFTAINTSVQIWLYDLQTSVAGNDFALDDISLVAVPCNLNAGADQAVNCVAAFPGGTATMVATGTGTWSADPLNSGTATITATSSSTTTITNFSASGTYNFIWANGTCSDTAIITVTGKPNAGANQTVCAAIPGGSATMAANGIGTWTAQAGNPGTASITTPSSPTTTITNFSVAGTYNFVWTNGTCTDTAAVTVNAKPNAGPDKTVSCVASLPGGSVTMAAVGFGIWVPLTSPGPDLGTEAITNSISPTTTIKNFSLAGAYTFIWTNGTCQDTAAVTVTAKPNGGANQTVACITTFPGGTATMAGSGTGTWSAQTGNPGTAMITTTSSPTTTITNFSVAGTYTFIWNDGTCSATTSVTVTGKPNAGVDQTVNCVSSFPGGTATMAASGTGTWSAQVGNPGTATIMTTSSPTTVIKNFSIAGTYGFVWTNGTCSDTAIITVTGKPNAGVDQTVNCISSFPDGTATMAASGTGNWTADPNNAGTASITSTSSPTTSITNFSAAGTYNFIWANGSCSDTAVITVTAKPDAGADQTVNCVTSFPGGYATMTANGVGTWTADLNNAGAATIVNTTSPTTSITNFIGAGTYNFIWTNGTCSDTAIITVTAKPDAGADQTVNCVSSFPGGTATMSASGTGSWAADPNNEGTASIVNSSSPTTTITDFSEVGIYNFIWTNGTCSDTAIITVTGKPNAGADQTVNCVSSFPDGTATMSASGTGSWAADPNNEGTASIVNSSSPTTTITDFSEVGIYNFIWTNGTCSDTAIITVTGKPNAGADQTVNCVSSFPGGTATMAASGIGNWMADPNNAGTASITNTSSPTTSITNFSAAGTYNFIWNNGSCSDTAIITVTGKPYAGIDQTIECVASSMDVVVTMTATGTGMWDGRASLGNPGSVLISDPTSPTAVFKYFGAIGNYNFIWTDGTCNDTVAITITGKPIAGTDQTVNCVPSFPGGIATMSASGTGNWTADPNNASTAIITNASSPTTTITDFGAAGSYDFIWTSGGCNDTANITVTGKPNAGADQMIDCVSSFPGGSATMSASGIGNWTADPNNASSASITNTSSPTTAITDFNAAGSYNFIWTNGTCSDTATITVMGRPNAGANQTVDCVSSFPGGSATMDATGAGIWTAQAGNLGTANITTPSSASTTITNFSTAGAYNFIWSNGVCTDTVSIIVTPKISAGPDQTISCVQSFPGGSATMSATGNAIWSAQVNNPGAATITDINDPATTIANFSMAGSYNFIWGTLTGCTSTVKINVTAATTPPTVVAGSVCGSGIVQLSASGSGILNWYDDAALSNTINTGTTYNPDLTNTTLYYVTATANNCTSLPATVNATINPLPTPDIGDPFSICPGGTIVLNAGNYAAYLWQDNSTKQTYVVNNPGNYSVLVTSIEGCKASATISVGLSDDCSDIRFPSAFTPNGDGNNDYFHPLGNIAAIENYSLLIYNKWGQLVFSTTNPYQKWDGQFKGELCNGGNYIWYAKYLYMNKQRIQQGNLILVR